jgi:peroxiredoxin
MSGTRLSKVSLLDADGKDVPLADLAAGSVPVLLAFFKATCPTCKLTWPYLQRLHASHGTGGGSGRVRIVGVSQNERAAAQRFYEQFGGATFELMLDPEPAFKASNAFDVESVPHLALLTPGAASGVTVAWTFAGWSRKAMEELAARVASGEGAPAPPLIAADDPVPAWKAG